MRQLVELLIILVISIVPVHAKASEQQDLVVAGFGSPPFLDLKKRDEGLPTGIDTDILSIILKKLNMTVAFEKTETWGHATESGKWSGTVGKVANGTADLGLHVMIEAQRLQVVNFGTPIYPIRMSYVSAKPKPLPQYLNVTKPFSVLSWALCIMALICTLTSLMLAHFVHKALGEWLDLVRSCLFTFGLILHQAWPISRWKRKSSSHILYGFWLLFGTMMIMFYRCNLEACLISLDHEPLIETSKDVVEQDRSLYIAKGHFVETFFGKSPSKYDRQVLKSTQLKSTFLGDGQKFTPETFRDITGMGGVLISSHENFPSLAYSYLKCYGEISIRISNHPLSTGYSAFIYPKESQLKESFDKITHHLLDNGIIAKLYANNVPVLIDMKGKVERDNIPLNLDHILVGGALLLTGMLISGILFLAELKAMK